MNVDDRSLTTRAGGCRKPASRARSNTAVPSTITGTLDSLPRDSSGTRLDAATLREALVPLIQTVVETAGLERGLDRAPRLVRVEQLRNLQPDAKDVISGNRSSAASAPSSPTNPISRRPGVSTTSASPTWNVAAHEVVWLPLPAALRPPVRSSSDGSSAFRRLDLPAPEGPMKATKRPAIARRRSSRPVPVTALVTTMGTSASR